MFSNTKSRNAFLILIIALSFGVYTSSLSNAFVWDDAYEILQNRWIRDITFLPDIFFSHSLGWLTPEQSSTKYSPMKLFVRLLQYHVSGTDPWAYQLTNILVHVLSSVMVFVISARLFAVIDGEQSALFPFAASVLFALHPIHTEPVNWAIGLSELSMSFFCLLSFYLFIKSDGNSMACDILSGISLFIALLFKITAISFLPVYAAYHYAKRRSDSASQPDVSRKSAVTRYAPLAVAVAGYAALFLYATLGESDPVRATHIKLDAYHLMLNVPLLFIQYLEKLVFPIQLNALYLFYPVTAFTEAGFLLPLCFMLMAFFLMIAALKRYTLLSLGLLWIIAPLLPVLYLPATGYSYYVFAERYLYLPSAGYVIAIAAASKIILDRSLLQNKTKHILAVLLIITGLLFGAATLQRNPVWKNNYRLWSDTIEKSPGSSVAHNNLGSALEQEGLLDDALHEYETAISLDPTYMDSYENRFRVIKMKEFLQR